jgi:hypothetical protein
VAVAFDAVGPSASGTTGASSPLTWTHVCGASATHLLVGATWDGNPDGGGSLSATYNGVAMTSLGVWHCGGGTAGFLQVWALASPATGSHSVSVTAGGSPLGLNGGSVSFTGSATLSAVQTSVSSGNVANAALTFTGSISGNVVAAFVGGGSPQTPTGSFTSRYNENAGSGQQGAGYTACSTIASPGGSTTASWTMNADLSAVAAVEVQAGGAAATVLPIRPYKTKLPRRYLPVRRKLLAVPLPPQTFQPSVTLSGSGTLSAVAFPVIAGIGGTGGASAGYFADQSGSPRFLLADNPWALIANAGRWGGTWQADIDGYCDNRGGQGYTAVYLAPLGNAENNGVFADGRTQDGVFPFTVNGTPASTASLSGSETIGLNATFWARVDYFLSACLRNGMTGMLNVAYEGPGDFAAGGAYATMTASQFGQYGTALASRYAAVANIIWVVGNDYFGGTGGTIGSGGGTPAGDDAKFSSLLSGLRGGGDAHVITIHNFAESNSREDLGSGTAGTVLQWGNNNAQFNGNYTYNVTYLGIETAYGEPSPLPVMQLDGYFYQGTSTYSASPAYDRAFRQDAWWAVSSGARGVSQGSESIWQWASTSLAASGTDWFYVHNAGNIRTLIESLPNWHLLIPDTGSVLVTAGRGTRAAAFASGGGHGQYEPAVTDAFVSASRTAAGDLAVIYLSHATSITIDQTKMVAGYAAYWADPITGAKTLTTAGSTYNSATPGSNSQGDPDWVLVLQAASSVSGTASLSGSGTLTAGPQIAATAALSGSGTLSASGVTLGTTAGLSGSGTLTASPALAGAAALAGAGTLSASPALAASASLSGAGTLSAAPVLAASASLSGSGTLTVSGVILGTAAALSGSGTLTAAPRLEATASLSGTGTLSAGDVLTGAASLSGSGSLTAVPRLEASASLSGAGTLTAASSGVTGASLSGSGTLGAVWALSATVALSGAGTLAAAPRLEAAAALSGLGALTAGPVLTGTAALSGSGTLTASPRLAGTATLSGSGTLGVAQGQAAATLSGAGTLTAAPALAAAAALSGTGTLSPAGALTLAGAASLSGLGSLTVMPQIGVTAALSGVGVLTLRERAVSGSQPMFMAFPD